MSDVLSISTAKPDLPRTASGRIRITLEQDILKGTLAPGTRLDEIGDSARLGVSRTPVCKALNQLTASGLEVISAHEGATVVKPILGELLKKFEVMSLLETLCAQIAAQLIVRRTRGALAERQQAEGGQ